LPGLQFRCAGFDRGHAPLNLNGPGRFSAGIGRTIKTGQKFSSDLRAGVKVEAQGVSENGFCGLGHNVDPTLGFAAQQALAAGAGHEHMRARG
jgi:hypothetical protein